MSLRDPARAIHFAELTPVIHTPFADSEAEVAAEMEAVDGPVDAKAEAKMDGKLVQSEEKAIGRSMSFRSLKIYLKTLGGIPFFTFVIGGLVCDCGLITLQTWWLSVWARAYEGDGPVNVWYYIAVYGLMMFVAMIAYGLGAGLWYVGSIKSGIRLHKMVHRIVSRVLEGRAMLTPSCLPVARLHLRRDLPLPRPYSSRTNHL